MEYNRELLVQLLEEEYEILTIADGAAGIEVAAGEQPHLTLMDLSLPGIDGWEAIRRLKAKPATAAIPVIALTAHAMQDDQERARACGCDDYLAKPIDEDQLFYSSSVTFAQAAQSRPRPSTRPHA